MELRTPFNSLRPLVAALSIALASTQAAADASARVEFRPSLAGLAAQPTAVVSNCDDAGPGSLREAYANAVDGDVIDATGLTCSTITLTTGALIDSPLAENVTIVGPGQDLLTVDGSHANRVLVHNGEQLLGLAGLTIKNGSYLGYYGGGCIYSYGDVALEEAVVTGCSLRATNSDNAYGGAIYAHGEVEAIYSAITDSSAISPHGNSGGGAIHARSVRILASTIAGNTVAGDGGHLARGGGISVAADVRIGYSLFADNTADTGGGLFILGASDTLVVYNSTLSGNHARGVAGGIYAGDRPLKIANSTIALNTAWFDFGAGIYLKADADLQSNLIAGNTSNDGLRTSDVGGNNVLVAITGANNLVIGSTLLLPSDTIIAEPQLGPLQDNGGRTWTHALLPGSPAIDRGNNAFGLFVDQRVYDPTVTQRGYERTTGAATDIGAFEFGSPDTIFYDGFDGQDEANHAD